jgi:hypothetical protein
MKRTGITGKTSTIGSKGAYASGNFASKKVIANPNLLGNNFKNCN